MSFSKTPTPETPAELTQQGIAAYKAGDIAQARRLLSQAVKIDKSSDTAWYYLSRTQNDISKRRDCLQIVLKLNPNHVDAQRELAALGGGGVNTAGSSSALDDDDRFGALSSVDAPSASASPAFVTAARRSAEALVASIPGAPQRVTWGETQVIAQELWQDSMTVILGESSPSTGAISATWWRVLFSVALTGLVIGLIGILTEIIQTLQWAQIGERINLLFIVFHPVLTSVSAVIAVGAGAFASHWYITASSHQPAKVTLLEHTALVTRVWIPISVGLAVIGLVARVFGGGVATLEMVLLGGLGLLSGAMWVFTLVAAGVTVYGVWLIVKGFQKLYIGDEPRSWWVTAFVMAFITALVF